MCVAFATAMVSLPSCTSEAPFSKDGEGLVKMNVVVNSRTTRSLLDSDYGTTLTDNCRIYISNENGVLHKWVGIKNVPSSGVSLRYGAYVAEGFAGDSVTASFDHVYFKGATEFTVGQDVSVTQVNLKCNIANVVASIDESTINNLQISDLKVVIANSKGELTYSGDDLFKRGYFMMPQDDTTLSYTITCKDMDGNEVTKVGEIKNVKPACEYHLQFRYDPDEFAGGGAFITINIEEERLVVEDDVVIFGKPSFSWVGHDHKVDGQLILMNHSEEEHTFRVAAYGFSKLELSTDNQTMANALGGSFFDLCGLDETMEGELANKGINIKTGSQDDLNKYFITLTPEFLKGLPLSDTEYVIDVYAEDVRGKNNRAQIRIANTEEAITYSDPIIVDTESMTKDLTSVSARSVTIPYDITDESIENPAIQYRKAGSSSWTTQNLNVSRAASQSVTLKGLEPGTEYEYRVVGGAVDNGTYEFESSISNFITESEFSIVNPSFEDWSTYTAQTMLGKKDVDLPGSTGDKLTSFWGSGNEGAATANKVLTKKSEDMKHSGQYSARLGSDAAMGIIAAGNIFVGHYVKTDGTNGVLSLGREYNGSHPSKVRVYANYRPGGNCTIKDGNEALVDITKDGTDQGQIYIALTDEPIEIRTNPNNRKLFDANDSHVIAYGQVTWKEAFGPDGQLEMVEIPFEYNSRAKTKKPTHLVIVASASKFGDYFCGSNTSVMYLDDFELVYE